MDGDPYLLDTAETGLGAARDGALPCLSIAWHADPARVGDLCPLEPPDPGAPPRLLELSRLTPPFLRASGEPVGPIDDPRVSRRPFRATIESDGTVTLERGDCPTPICVDGVGLDGRLRLELARIREGLTVSLGDVVLLVLHGVEPRLARVGMAPLTGSSDAVARVRQQIERVAERDFSVLVRGETGTGKAQVVRAIHAGSARRHGPLVIAHAAELAGPRAALALFGAPGKDGLFQEAQGGVLVLDDVGETTMDVQLMLQHAIERRSVLRAGADRPEPVDVRVLATTDHDLRPAVAARRFSRALFDTLAAVELVVPPLRERREDIGPLLLAFLRDTLAPSGQQDRLRAAGPRETPWLPVAIVERLVRHRWSGNVRQLGNVARQIAIAFQDDDVVLPARVAALIAEAPAGSGQPPSPPRRPPSEIPLETLLDVLRRNRWRFSRAAQELGISRGSVYNLVKRRRSIRQAGDIPEPELRRAYRELHGNLDALSDRFEVSPESLRIRLRRLRIT